MDYLEQRNLIRPRRRRNLLGNRIVLVAPADNGEARRAEARARLPPPSAGAGSPRRASPPSRPGKYGKAALEHLGLWSEVVGPARRGRERARRAHLRGARRGALGIVYETDAKAEPKVAIVARFPETSHPPIVYPAALTAARDERRRRRFLRPCATPASAAIFAREGFTPLD